MIRHLDVQACELQMMSLPKWVEIQALKQKTKRKTKRKVPPLLLLQLHSLSSQPPSLSLDFEQLIPLWQKVTLSISIYSLPFVPNSRFLEMLSDVVMLTSPGSQGHGTKEILRGNMKNNKKNN